VRNLRSHSGQANGETLSDGAEDAGVVSASSDETKGKVKLAEFCGDSWSTVVCDGSCNGDIDAGYGVEL